MINHRLVVLWPASTDKLWVSLEQGNDAILGIGPCQLLIVSVLFPHTIRVGPGSKKGTYARRHHLCQESFVAIRVPVHAFGFRCRSGSRRRRCSYDRRPRSTGCRLQGQASVRTPDGQSRARASGRMRVRQRERTSEAMPECYTQFTPLVSTAMRAGDKKRVVVSVGESMPRQASNGARVIESTESVSGV